MNQFEINYKKLLNRVLNKGVYRNDRTGIGSYSLFSQKIAYNLSSNRFPIITGKKIHFNTIITEFLWFLNGETNLDRFHKNNIYIWDAWAKNGELGPVYGKQLRNYNGSNIDQLHGLIRGLQSNPDGRRHIIILWNPQELSQMALPPCYLYFQFFVNGNKLNMQIVQRSADLFIGVPYDIGLYALLLIYISQRTNYFPGIIDLIMVDAHIYKNQLNQIKEYLNADIFDLPKFNIKINDLPENLINNDFELINYISGKYIKTPIAI